MSYEPQILIKKFDLEKHRNAIEEIYFLLSNKDEKYPLYKELHDALSIKPIIFLEREFIIIRPELTSHNNLVRKWLGERGIEFTTDY